MDQIESSIGLSKEIKAKVASWKCKFIINKDCPTDNFILDSCNLYGRFAKICQQNNLIPIVEIHIENEGYYDPEVNHKVSK